MNIIDEAADRLRGHWCKGMYSNEQGDYCMAGAFWAVVSEEPSPFTMYEFQVLESVTLAETGCSVAPFNDDPSTTEEDVLLIMKKASARLDEVAS